MLRYSVKVVVSLMVILVLLSNCGPRPTPKPTQTPVTPPPATTVPSPTVEPTDAPMPTEDDAVSETDEESKESGENAEVAEAEDVEVVPPEEAGFCETVAPSPVDETDWVKGPEDAEITIFEYSDFQCPYCGVVEDSLSKLLEDYPDVRLVYRHFPLNIRDKALVTAEASEAAGAQGKFWEMHDLLFARAEEWGALDAEAALDTMSEYAEELDLDVEKFDREMEAHTYLDEVQADYEESVQLGLRRTPSFVFNAMQYPGGLSYEGFVAFMEVLPEFEAKFVDPPEMSVDFDLSYQAKLDTTAGEIVVDFFNESAPTHINNFFYLANQDWYADSDFFFAPDYDVAVTGDPTNTGVGYPGYYCFGELQGQFAQDGLVGMLPNGQFFITLGENAEQLSGSYALIGQVVEGMDVVESIKLQSAEGADSSATVLKSVEVSTN